MVYENIIPKTETVYELKNETQSVVGDQIPSFEKFMKTYQDDEGANDSYYYEIDSHGDISVIRPYGPGFWEGVGEVAKFGAKVGGGMVIGAAVAATGPFAIPLGAAVAAEGYFVKKASEQSDNEAVRAIGGFAGDTVMGGGIGGVSSAVMGAASSSLASKGANLAFNSALSNGSEELLRVWLYTKAAQMGYELGSKSKQTLEGFASFYHGLHEVSYEKDCPICNGNFDKYFWL